MCGGDVWRGSREVQGHYNGQCLNCNGMRLIVMRLQTRASVVVLLRLRLQAVAEPISSSATHRLDSAQAVGAALATAFSVALAAG
jgi:hypothetical protein